MKFVSPKLWKASEEIILEESADKAIRADRSTLVVAGPGAGKTELLAQRASYLFQTNICRAPKKILALSFKNDAADNLKKRVIKRCSDEVESRFISMTYDSFSKGLLDRFRYALPEDLRPNASYIVNDQKVIEAAFRKVGHIIPSTLKPYERTSYYENLLISIRLPFTNDNLIERVWKLLLKGFDDYGATLSFKMICILAEYIISTNPKIKNALQHTYKYIFLDEFQDTTKLQYALVKQCFGCSSAILTAVGDNKQRIMVWAGALKTVFKDFVEDFNADKQILIMNHRSAPRLVDLQKRMYESLNESHTMVDIQGQWTESDGDITLLIAEDDNQEAAVISEYISKQIKTGIKPNELCILCKQKPGNYVTKIISELGKKQIYARIEDNYQSLIKEPIIEMLLSIFRLAIDRKHPNEWKCIVEKTMKLWNVSSIQSNEDYFEMQERLDAKLKEIKTSINRVKCKTELDNLIKNIICFWGVRQIHALFPIYKQSGYLESQLIKFQEYIWLELEATEFDWIVAMDRFLGVYSVPIMTIHKSKGLEYDTVYFVGLEDAAFWKFKEQPEEDRCAFFVALSRAKRQVFFTFCNFRSSIKYPNQSHKQINEFFELLNTKGVANIIKI